MKPPSFVTGCFLLVIAMFVVFLPQTAFAVPAGPSSPELVGSFEGGERYLEGTYNIIVLNGSFREMGRQYGALMKTELLDEYSFIITNLSERGYTKEQVREMARESVTLQPQRMREIVRGMADTSGLTVDDIDILYEGGVLFLMLPAARPSCSFLAAWGDYTLNGSVVLSRNWDLPDLINKFNPWYVLAVYRPADGSNSFATFGPAGMRPETLMNSKGLFIADDNGVESGGDTLLVNRPDIISEFFRFMLDYSDLRGLDAAIQANRPNIAWIVNAGGPEGVYSYEMTINETKQRKGDGVIAAANHFVDPAWNLSNPPAENSLTRYNNLIRQAEEAKGTIDAGKMMEIRDVVVDNGGATFRHSDLLNLSYSSNHQVVFEPRSLTLWMKVVDRDWQQVNLDSLFGT